MKKLIAIVLALTLALSLFGCAKKDDPNVKSEGVMTHAQYLAAEEQATVKIEAYVQATQSWYKDQITIYAQDTEGGYFLYNMKCSQEDAAKLTKGTKIRATGSKTSWAGEIEIMEGTLEILEGNYAPAATDLTAKLGTDELINYQNMFAAFKGLTVVASAENDAAYLYGWDGAGDANSDSDLYFKAAIGDQVYTFVIEYYLTGPDSDAYKAVQNLKVGDKIDLEGFVYWYEGPQPHITSVKVVG